MHYIEGCTAPNYSHRVAAQRGGGDHRPEGRAVRYTTIQNWSDDVYNLVTKRAMAYKDATVEWMDGNIGSKRTMKYPSIYLMGEGAHGEVLYRGLRRQGPAPGRRRQGDARRRQHHEQHRHPLHQQGQRAHPLPRPPQGGRRRTTSRSRVRCDALILDEESRSNTYPYMEIETRT